MSSTGTVIKSTGSRYTVRDAKGNFVDALVKGKLRLKLSRNTNPIAVGDKVNLELQEDNTYGITDVLPRKNYIIRRSTNLSKQTHVIAANLDQALLLVTTKEPFTPLGFIDRFLLTAEAYHIPTILLFNKWDQYNEVEKEKTKSLMAIYEKIGYQCFTFSVHDSDPEFLKSVLKDKTTLVSGHSGVGKSSLINLIQPGLTLKTGSVSTSHKKGTHTTTFYEMFILDFGGEIIDSPGIKGFGVVEIDKNELSHYFPEMRKALVNCKFNNCLHIDEPKCAVKDAVESGEIAFHRYKNYLNIYYDRETEDEEKYD
ncbi:MAG TPA: ribosome small subunit-dependent GTPase A [Flavobacteriales bacterium]|nr:ribosome small subunit-dependent GTPase A [Flavobacteriales bacterium]